MLTPLGLNGNAYPKKNARGQVSAWATSSRGKVPRIVSLVTGSDEEAAGIVRAGFATQTVDTTNYKLNGRAWQFTSTGAIANPTITFTLPNAPMAITPAQALCVWVYIPDVSNVTNVLCSVNEAASGTAGIQRGSNTTVDPVKTPLVNGWNFLRFGLAYAMPTNWTGSVVTRFILQLNIPQGATNSITIGHAYLECPEKAKLIWSLDRGYKSFVLNGGLARMRANNIPITWAVDPLRVGTDVGTGAEGVTEADLARYWAEGDSISFHSYSGNATSGITASQARQDTMQAIKWLQQRGYEGRIWRAAWVQNDSGGNNGAVKDLVLAQAFGTPGLPEATCVDAWPPSDMHQIMRWAIVGASAASDFVDRQFSRLQRSRGMINAYTHGIIGPNGSTGAAAGVPGNDSTIAEFDYFMTKVEAALAAGWLEATTFEAAWYEAGGSFSTVGGATQATWVGPDGTAQSKTVL